MRMKKIPKYVKRARIVNDNPVTARIFFKKRLYETLEANSHLVVIWPVSKEMRDPYPKQFYSNVKLEVSYEPESESL